MANLGAIEFLNDEALIASLNDLSEELKEAGVIAGRLTTKAMRVNLIRTLRGGSRTGRIYDRGGRSHQASAPGEPPAEDYGYLAASIYTKSTRGALGLSSAIVGSSSGYASTLEFGGFSTGGVYIQPRPMWLDELTKQRTLFPQRLKREIARILARTK